jgi:hypothetical protein
MVEFSNICYYLARKNCRFFIIWTDELFNQTSEQSNIFFHYNCWDDQMASFFTVIRINALFAFRRYSPWINIAIRMLSFLAVIRIHVLHPYLLTYTHTYIHAYNKLFMYAGLNNSELISTRGVILEHTVQINITRLYNIQKQRKMIYYIGNRTSQFSVFAW